MHLNYYFLRKLVPRLAKEIRGTSLQRVFSQDKDEIILEFGSEEKTNFTIRSILKTDFTSLFFPDRFERARANSVDLFRELYGRPVEAVSRYENERAFAIVFQGGDKLVFKMFGNRSNLLHFDAAGELVRLFNHRLAGDRQLEEASLSRPLDQSFRQFAEFGGDYRKMFPTFGKLVDQYLRERMEARPDIEGKWEVIKEVLSELDRGVYYITEFQDKVVLSLLPVGEIRETYDDPVQALNAFCLSYFRVGNLQSEKDRVTKQLTKRIGQTESYLNAAYEKLDHISEIGKNEQYGSLLMAHLQAIPPRAEFVELESFYTGEPVRIKLKSDLSPAKNAEAYFRKAKNEKQEVTRLQENIEAREEELARMKIWLNDLKLQPTVKDLRNYLRTNEILAGNAMSTSPRDSKFRKETFMGYTIFIGKNAKNNDELTLKHANKDDLWLHARDVSGSHVVIRSIPGQKIPSPVIERAAELAAWHSKRRNDSLCPVIVTPRKFVRKAKGMAAGAVLIEKESVVMVVPKD